MANNLAKNMTQTHTYHFVKKKKKKNKQTNKQTYLCHNLTLKAFNTEQKIISSSQWWL